MTTIESVVVVVTFLLFAGLVAFAVAYSKQSRYWWHKFKRAVRREMRRTGESYCAVVNRWQRDDYEWWREDNDKLCQLCGQRSPGERLVVCYVCALEVGKGTSSL